MGRARAGDADGGAQLAHQAQEARETGRNRANVIDHHWLFANEAKNEEAHGDAVVVMGDDGAAAWRFSAFAINHKVVALFPRVDAIGAKPGDDGGKAVTLLHAQFGKPAHDAASARTGGGDGQNGVFINHTRSDVGRHIHLA